MNGKVLCVLDLNNLHTKYTYTIYYLNVIKLVEVEVYLISHHLYNTSPIAIANLLPKNAYYQLYIE